MKNIIVALVAACFISMGASSDAPGAMVVCESGRINSNFCNDRNTMETCFGVPKTALFKNNFLMPPEVTIGFSKLNMGNIDNTRVNTQMDVTVESVTVQFICMIKSHCYSASVNYMACGFVDVATWNAANKK